MTPSADQPAKRLVPEITDENRQFWEAAGKSLLVAQKCEHCGNQWLPPTSACPRCLSEGYEWAPLSGHGVIYTWTLIQRQYHPAYPPPYNVAVVELDEGVRILTNIVGGDPGAIHIGDTVSVTFTDIGDGIKLPQFTRTA
jgi:uncharacterized OB-fold protein